MPRKRAIKRRIKGMTYPFAEWTDAYVDWVAECISVRKAYEVWTRASTDDAFIAFAAYRAALDREEQASKSFAALAT